MLLACYSHKHISYRIRTIIRKAIISKIYWSHKDLQKSNTNSNSDYHSKI
ncbi:hypothetical protein [Wolbachia endosymbiont (group A) of Scambus nigricans]|nr:hypothetical protein [Wolbachia endosymbiont (group A) of Scambus nigricans]